HRTLYARHDHRTHARGAAKALNTRTPWVTYPKKTTAHHVTTQSRIMGSHPRGRPCRALVAESGLRTFSWCASAHLHADCHRTLARGSSVVQRHASVAQHRRYVSRLLSARRHLYRARLAGAPTTP